MSFAYLVKSLDLDIVLNAGVSASSTTTATTGKDISNLVGDILIGINARSGGTGTVTVAVEHSESLSTGYSAVPAAALIDAETGQPTTLATFSTTGYDVVVGLRRDLVKQYIRVTFAGTTLTQNYVVVIAEQKKYTDN